MVAKFLEHANGFEGLAAFAAEEGFDIGAADEMVVKVELEGGEVAEDDVLVFSGEVFGEDVVGSADDEFVDDVEEFFDTFVSSLAVLLTTGRIPTSQDREFVFLTEVQSSP